MFPNHRVHNKIIYKINSVHYDRKFVVNFIQSFD